MLAFIAIVALSLHYAPQLSRRDIFFGVTVPHGFRDSPAARDIARQYAIEVWFLAAVAAAFVVSSPMPAVSGWMLAVQTMGASVAYARAWSRARSYAAAPA